MFSNKKKTQESYKHIHTHTHTHTHTHIYTYIYISVSVNLGFPCGSAGKESTCNMEDLGLIPELGRSPGEGNGYPFQYSGLENVGGPH